MRHELPIEANFCPDFHARTKIRFDVHFCRNLRVHKKVLKHLNRRIKHQYNSAYSLVSR